MQLENHLLCLQLAHALKAAGELGAAKNILLKLLEEDPHAAPAYNNLGAIYFSERQWHDAAAAFQAAIHERPDYIDAYYNLGLALTKCGRTEEAQNAYQALLRLSENHVGALFQMASLYMLQEKWQLALSLFLNIEKRHPFHFETETNLATCYLGLGQFADAKIHYLKANEINPDDEQVALNLGVMNMQQARLDDAISFYLRVLKINPSQFAAHNNLGVTYLAKRNTAAALLHFREAAKLDPDNKALLHVINMLTAKKGLVSAPIEYVRSLFDFYAGHYDAHLKKNLNYHVPNLIFETLKPFLSHEKLDVLDLGCGTGLCGERLRSIAKKLIGVDVSEKMLAIARQKAIYDELILSEMTDYLSQQSASYDLVVAGDVLVYLGELATVFAKTARALKSNGYFVLSTELGEKETYSLTSSGRFAHQKMYLDQLAYQHGFDVCHYQCAPLREDRGRPLMGQVYVLQKRCL